MNIGRVTDSRASHSIPVWAVEEDCRRCHQKASHKIEEVSGPATFHPLTAYLCCGCFCETVGYSCSEYPYDTPDPAPWTPPTDPESDPAIRA